MSEGSQEDWGRSLEHIPKCELWLGRSSASHQQLTWLFSLDVPSVGDLNIFASGKVFWKEMFHHSNESCRVLLFPGWISCPLLQSTNWSQMELPGITFLPHILFDFLDIFFPSAWFIFSSCCYGSVKYFPFHLLVILTTTIKQNKPWFLCTLPRLQVNSWKIVFPLQWKRTGQPLRSELRLWVVCM